MLAEARKIAHEAGIPQDTFSRLLSVYAGSVVQQQQTFKAARDAEIAKLGTTGSARVDAITTWAKSTLGEELGAVAAASLHTAAHVQMFENIMSRLRTQGSGSYQANNGESRSASPSDDEWNKMTIADRLDYARKSAQGRAA